MTRQLYWTLINAGHARRRPRGRDPDSRRRAADAAPRLSDRSARSRSSAKTCSRWARSRFAAPATCSRSCRRRREPRRHHLFVRQSRPGGGAGRAALRHARGGRHAGDGAAGQSRRRAALRRRGDLRRHDVADRKARAERSCAARRGLTIVPPFDHPWIIAGPGTVGLEILEQCPHVTTVFVPMGGGGLISGVSAAIKGMRSGVRIDRRRAGGRGAKMSASLRGGASGHARARRRASPTACSRCGPAT